MVALNPDFVALRRLADAMEGIGRFELAKAIRRCAGGNQPQPRLLCRIGRFALIRLPRKTA